MSKSDMIEVEGTVVEVLPNTTFKVTLQNDHIIIAHISGKLRMNNIKSLAKCILPILQKVVLYGAQSNN